VAVTDSEGFIEVAVVNGSAAKSYGIKLDEAVRIGFND
jgi:S-adenosylmethionine hydrolase